MLYDLVVPMGGGMFSVDSWCLACAQYVTLPKYFSYTSLVIYFFFPTPTIKLKLRLQLGETEPMD